MLIDNGGATGKWFGWMAVLMERLYDDEFGESISQNAGSKTSRVAAADLLDFVSARGPTSPLPSPSRSARAGGVTDDGHRPPL